MGQSADDVFADWHRAQAVEANNSTWELLDGRSLSPSEADDLLGRAYASTYHWARARPVASPPTRRGVPGSCRGRTPCSATASSLCTTPTSAPRRRATAGLDDFDLAYASEARARALACLGRLDEARIERKAARAVDIADAEDRSIFETDLAAEPWFGLNED